MRAIPAKSMPQKAMARMVAQRNPANFKSPSTSARANCVVLKLDTSNASSAPIIIIPHAAPLLRRRPRVRSRNREANPSPVFLRYAVISTSFVEKGHCADYRTIVLKRQGFASTLRRFETFARFFHLLKYAFIGLK